VNYIFWILQTYPFECVMIVFTIVILIDFYNRWYKINRNTISGDDLLNNYIKLKRIRKNK